MGYLSYERPTLQIRVILFLVFPVNKLVDANNNLPFWALF